MIHKQPHIQSQTTIVTRQERERRHGQRGRLVWLTGLSGAGKSTLAFALERALFEQGKLCYVLDGDQIRQGLNADLGFSAADRHENLRRIGEVARLLVDAGQIVIAAFVSPYRSDRAMVRQMFADTDFDEIYIDCPLHVCEQRDPKGLYAKARAGLLPGLTGIDDPYEAPDMPELVIRTELLSVAEAVLLITETLELSVEALPTDSLTSS
ncbi:adenylyl-sulfate kinase [Paenibacillus campi]|uniref:adenylyl-sulfate kinase n=1 Tax=Paenibacillus campi TaxID=3106031 RepID=UPI002AFE5401|nr:adenylyl-sulfate kinase [Paenibacillus sp. SGZ-1009]